MRELYLRGLVDRDGWGKGPWDDEMDKCQFTNPATGLPICLVRAARMGHWLGYAGIIHEEHPLWGKGYFDDEVSGLTVHGGVTFAQFNSDIALPDGNYPDINEPFLSVQLEEDDPKQIYWLGFDCAHYQDLSPGIPTYGSYRTFSYVYNEACNLAQQIHDIYTRKPGTYGLQIIKPQVRVGKRKIICVEVKND